MTSTAVDAPQSSSPPPASAEGPRRGAGSVIWRLFVKQREIAPLVITGLIFVYFVARTPVMYSSLSISSAAGYAGPTAGIAIGMVMLLMLAEIDLSAGQVFLFAPWVVYWFWQLGVPVGFAMVISLVICAGVGATKRTGLPDAGCVSPTSDAWSIRRGASPPP